MTDESRSRPLGYAVGESGQNPGVEELARMLVRDNPSVVRSSRRRRWPTFVWRFERRRNSTREPVGSTHSSSFETWIERQSRQAERRAAA